MCFSDSISAQLQLALAKADSEQLARSISDEQLLDVEKAKTMLELQMKDMMQRHKSEQSKKDNVIALLEDSNTKVTVVLEDTKKDKEDMNNKLQMLTQGRSGILIAITVLKAQIPVARGGQSCSIKASIRVTSFNSEYQRLGI